MEPPSTVVSLTAAEKSSFIRKGTGLFEDGEYLHFGNVSEADAFLRCALHPTKNNVDGGRDCNDGRNFNSPSSVIRKLCSYSAGVLQNDRTQHGLPQPPTVY